MVISILLKPTFWQISIYSQSLVKLLWRSDNNKITFKAIEKYRYGLWKTTSKHLKEDDNPGRGNRMPRNFNRLVVLNEPMLCRFPSDVKLD